MTKTIIWRVGICLSVFVALPTVSPLLAQSTDSAQHSTASTDASFDEIDLVADEVRRILASDAYYLKAPYPDAWASWDVEHLKDYLKSIDRWSSLHKPQPNNHTIVGIGANLYREKEQTFWLLPYENGVLKQSGISDRVQLLAVDGKATAGLDLKQVGKLLQKPMGQRIRLTLCAVHKDCQAEAPQVISLSPQPYRFHSVQRARIGKHSVLRLLTFDKNTTQRLRQLISQQLISQQLINQQLSAEQSRLAAQPKPAAHGIELTRIDSPSASPSVPSPSVPSPPPPPPPKPPKPKPMIIDMRDNWGGSLPATLDSLSLFLPSGDVLISMFNHQGKVRHYYASHVNKIHTKRPMILLVSKRTASAGEIFAGVLRHYGKAVVVGEQTFGKCVSQNQKTLSDGRILRYTNFEVVLPETNHCEKVGIKPQFKLDSHQIDNIDFLSETLDVLQKRLQ